MSCKRVFFSVERVFQHLANCDNGATFTGVTRVMKDAALSDGIIFKPTKFPEARVVPFVRLSTLVPMLVPTIADEQCIFRAAISKT
jgi:hypothetical protein